MDEQRKSERPTLICAGSHNTLWLEHASGKQSRFTDSKMREVCGRPGAELGIVPMVGPRGGGFVFDTNTAHKGELGEGAESDPGKRPMPNRTTLVLEFHSRGKIGALKRLGYKGPCPSNAKTQLNITQLVYGSTQAAGLYAPDEPSAADAILIPQAASPQLWVVSKAGQTGSGLYMSHYVKALPHVTRKSDARRPVGQYSAWSLPIEPLPAVDWRRATKSSTANGWASLRVTYLPEVLGYHEVRSAPQRVYVDLGANLYDSSIGNWFLRRYPLAASFESIVAVEAETKYDYSYVAHPEVELLHYAAWTENKTLSWGKKFVLNSSRPHGSSSVAKGQVRQVTLAT